MSKECKITLVCLAVYFTASIATYGHAVNRYRHENKIECQEDRKRDRNARCFDSSGIAAFGAALLPPYYWSEYGWSK